MVLSKAARKRLKQEQKQARRLASAAQQQQLQHQAIAATGSRRPGNVPSALDDQSGGSAVAGKYLEIPHQNTQSFTAAQLHRKHRRDDTLGASADAVRTANGGAPAAGGQPSSRDKNIKKRRRKSKHGKTDARKDTAHATSSIVIPMATAPSSMQCPHQQQLAANAAPNPCYPFDVDPADHCETPAQAYADLAPVLQVLALQLGLKEPAQLRVYDPYYCQGRVCQHLAALGFPRCHNVCEDFYGRVAAVSTH
eukprot:SAG31_NODE_3563_length_4120_cov_7.088286_4_plen_252_part_00